MAEKQKYKKIQRDVPDEEMLGATETVRDPESDEDILIITGLEENLLAVDEEKMNKPFKEWKEVLSAYNDRPNNRGLTDNRNLIARWQFSSFESSLGLFLFRQFHKN